MKEGKKSIWHEASEKQFRPELKILQLIKR